MQYRVQNVNNAAHVGGIGAAKLLVAMTGERLFSEGHTPLGPSITRLTGTERPSRRGSAYARAPEVDRWETYHRP